MQFVLAGTTAMKLSRAPGDVPLERPAVLTAFHIMTKLRFGRLLFGGLSCHFLAFRGELPVTYAKCHQVLARSVDEVMHADPLILRSLGGVENAGYFSLNGAWWMVWSGRYSTNCSIRQLK